jgi:hypothetical protein
MARGPRHDADSLTAGPVGLLDAAVYARSEDPAAFADPAAVTAFLQRHEVPVVAVSRR